MSNLSKSRQMDMLNGPLLSKLILFSLPLAASSILQQLFNSVDTAVVGRFANAQALAAVGTNGEIISLFVSLFAGISVGANVLIANYIGKGQREKIQSAVHTIIFLALCCGVLLMVFGQIIARPLLQMIDTPEDVLELAVTYLKLYFLGSPFLMLYDFGGAILRAKGDSRRPLNALLFSGVINLFLNLFFVIICKMSVAGVAIATDISTAISAGIVMYYLMTEEEAFRLHWRMLNHNGKDLKRIMSVGLPAGIQGAVFCVANVFIQSAINSFGSNAVAGAAAGLNFEYFSYYIITAFTQATTTFISQNFAAGKLDRCIRVFWICLIGAAVGCAILSVPFTVFRYKVVRLYSTDPEVIDFACRRIMRVLVFQPVCTFMEVPAAAIRGMGKSLTPAMETILGTCVFRPIWLMTVFAHFRTYNSIFWVYPVSWVLTGSIITISFYLYWRKIRRIYGDD